MIPFSLPADVSYSREPMADGMMYRFRHVTLGELGRLLVRDHGVGQCHITAEVAGDPDDPRTAARRELFEPLADRLTQRLESLLNRGVARPAPPRPSPSQTHTIPTKAIPCATCGEMVALLVFADGASEPGQIEDVARQVYGQYRAMNVPTWIVGEPLGSPGFDTPSLVLRVWPNREPLRPLSPNELNPLIDALVEGHCQRV